jgi:hypothetical protein
MNMGLNDIFTLIIAVYGAVIATFLGIRELKRDKRRIIVIIEYVAFYERAQITITNIGHRPITITEVNMSVKQGDYWEQVPRNVLFFANPEDVTFPITINDGEYITLPLHIEIGQAFLESTKNIKVAVYDIEGNTYTKFRSRLYNPKWGYYEKRER